MSSRSGEAGMLAKGEPLYCPYLLFTLLYFLHVELKPSSLYITLLLLFIGVGRRLVPSMGCVRLGRKLLHLVGRVWSRFYWRVVIGRKVITHTHTHAHLTALFPGLPG